MTCTDLLIILYAQYTKVMMACRKNIDRWSIIIYY